MLFFLQKHVQATWLLLIAITGLALGCLTATILGLNLGTPLPKTGPSDELAAAVGKKTLSAYGTIVQRNIFDSTSPGPATALAPEHAGQSSTVAAPRTDLKLFGTVTGDAGDSLALIEANKELKAYRIGDAVPGGGKLVEVIRNEAHIRYDDGSVSTLLLYQETATGTAASRPSRPAQGTDRSGIRSIAENRWLIDERVVEQARSNLGEVLKSARLEPRLVNGATNGFAIVMVRPGSLLAQMGFKRGDVILQVNGMALDSPEKALQIFQQLREARSLKINMERRGKPTQFEYEVN